MPNRPPTHRPVTLTSRHDEAHAEVRRLNDPLLRRAHALRGTARWQRVRDRFRRSHPLCCLCEREGRTTPATAVHHIRPLRECIASGQIGMAYASSNLASLCDQHHAKVDAIERRGGNTAAMFSPESGPLAFGGGGGG